MKNGIKGEFRIFRNTTMSKDFKGRDGHIVEILRTITKAEKHFDQCVLPMHKIKFLDTLEPKFTDCFPDELLPLTKGKFKDEEVLGVDSNGALIQWHKGDKVLYNCGENLEQFGKENLTKVECERLGIFCHPAGPHMSAMTEDTYKTPKVKSSRRKV